MNSWSAFLCLDFVMIVIGFFPKGSRVHGTQISPNPKNGIEKELSDKNQFLSVQLFFV